MTGLRTHGQPPDVLTVEELDAFFGDEGRFAVGEGDEGCAAFPDGGQWAICTSWAKYVRRILGERAELHGFFVEGNPEADLLAGVADGHDFALVDGRFLVDGWVRNVECLSGRAAFDLLDPGDAATIRRLYGDRARWKRLEGIEGRIDAETPEARAEALLGVAEWDAAPAPEMRA